MTGPFIVPDLPLFHLPWWPIITLVVVVGVPALFDTFHGRAK